MAGKTSMIRRNYVKHVRKTSNGEDEMGCEVSCGCHEPRSDWWSNLSPWTDSCTCCCSWFYAAITSNASSNAYWGQPWPFIRTWSLFFMNRTFQDDMKAITPNSRIGEVFLGMFRKQKSDLWRLPRTKKCWARRSRLFKLKSITRLARLSPSMACLHPDILLPIGLSEVLTSFHRMGPRFTRPECYLNDN